MINLFPQTISTLNTMQCDLARRAQRDDGSYVHEHWFYIPEDVARTLCSAEKCQEKIREILPQFDTSHAQSDDRAAVVHGWSAMFLPDATNVGKARVVTAQGFYQVDPASIYEAKIYGGTWWLILTFPDVNPRPDMPHLRAAESGRGIVGIKRFDNTMS
jgi:hypothetical protein